MGNKTRIHFMEIDLDHYGQFEDIFINDETSSISDFELAIRKTYRINLYEVIKISETERMFILGCNMRIYAWESDFDLKNAKLYRHARRYKMPMTIEEFEEKEL